MNIYKLLTTTLLFIGIILLITSYLSGQTQTGFILIFPFIIGTGLYALTGFICMLIAILIYFQKTLSHHINTQTKSTNFTETHEKDPFQKTSKKRFHTSGIVLIGPIPIIFGSNWKITLVLIIIALIFILTVVTYL